MDLGWIERLQLPKFWHDNLLGFLQSLLTAATQKRLPFLPYFPILMVSSESELLINCVLCVFLDSFNTAIYLEWSHSPSSGLSALTVPPIIKTTAAFTFYMYSGGGKYLASHQLCNFSHLKRRKRPVIFIIDMPQLWKTKQGWKKSRESHSLIFKELICKL